MTYGRMTAKSRGYSTVMSITSDRSPESPTDLRASHHAYEDKLNVRKIRHIPEHICRTLDR